MSAWCPFGDGFPSVDCEAAAQTLVGAWRQAGRSHHGGAGTMRVLRQNPGQMLGGEAWGTRGKPQNLHFMRLHLEE